jgi:hypothetical protein
MLAAELPMPVRTRIRSWQRELKRQPTIRERECMRRVGEMEAIAAAVRQRVLAGQATLRDLLIADGMARRARNDMERELAKYRVPPLPPSLDEIMLNG